MSKLPLCVYVVFHPEAKESRRLADYLFAWLRFAGQNTNAGLPVYYRCHLEGEDIAPRIDSCGATHNFLVLLVDDSMALDAKWRSALQRLVERSKWSGMRGIHVVPVMVDKSFEQLAFLNLPFNPVRIYAASDPAAPPDDMPPRYVDAAWAPRIDARGGRLRRALTETMIRLVRCDDEQVSPPRLKVFVSHAKQDGEDIARALRDELASVSQLEPWFDVNDLPAGRSAAASMTAAAARSTGGMIAVLTGAYPTRPWCRREAHVARRPCRRDLGRDITLWTAQPTIVVHGPMSQWSRAVGPLAQVRGIGWREGDNRGCVAEIVDQLLLEILMVEFNHRLIAGLGADLHRDRLFLDFVPDAWSLAELSRLTDCEPREVIYPGHRLGATEHGELVDVVRGTFGTATALRALESLHLLETDPRNGIGSAAPGSVASPKPSPLVALSAGGEFEDLFKAGIASVHVNDFLVRLSRTLLQEGCRLAYGGTLTHPNSLTAALLACGEGWRRDLAFDLDQSQAAQIAAQNQALANPPIRNYAGWPHCLKITKAKRAEHLGLCDFIDVYPNGKREATAAELAEWDEKNPRHVAEAMRRMREQVAEVCDVRVLFAGKVRGASGWLPGIAEELLTTLETERPYLLLSGFGGCAALLADYLLAPNGQAVWPEALTVGGEFEFRKQRNSEDDRRWIETTFGVECKRRYTRLQELLDRERRELAGEPPTYRGIPLDRWLEVAKTQDSATAAIRAVLRAIEALKVGT